MRKNTQAAKARLEAHQAKAQQDIVSIRTAKAPLEEYTEINDNRLYRYVYAYNDKKERTSETIYLREREDGKWGEETICAVGNYSYEYDTQGRVKVKAVTYDDNEEGFVTYRVMVDYAADGSATYVRYMFLEYEGGYAETERWTYRADGTLASHVIIDDSYAGEITTEYDCNGQVVAYNGNTHTGTLNHRQVSYNYGMGDTNDIENYIYDEKTGRLLMYECYSEYNDTQKITCEYDEYGRLTCIGYYDGEADGETSVELPESVEENATKQTRSDNSITWKLSEKYVYTYANNEVYPINSSWRAVFGMEGPLSSITMYEYDTYEGSDDLNGDGIIDERDDADNCEYIETLTFERDANGKLLALKVTDNETADVHSTMEYTVDGSGQIIGMRDEFKEVWGTDSYYYSLYQVDYTWENGWLTKETGVDKTEFHEGTDAKESSFTYSSNYQYTTDGFEVIYREGSSAGADHTMVQQDGMRYLIKNWYQSSDAEEYDFDFGTDNFLVRDVQTEDVWFFRPNIKADREGFAPEAPVILSVAGRVVCAAQSSFSPDDEGYFSCEWDNQEYYCNIMADDDEYLSKDELFGLYYSISHDGEYTIASNVEGLPIYVLKGNRLTKEYKYYKEAMSMGGGTRAVDIPQGHIYDEITYTYDDNGLLVGQQIVSVDENGTRSEEISIEYKYDTTGMSETVMQGKAGLQLKGRYIGADTGDTFCVYTLDGRLIAKDVQQHTCTQSGTYVVRYGNESIKLYVK